MLADIPHSQHGDENRALLGTICHHILLQWRALFLCSFQQCKTICSCSDHTPQQTLEFSVSLHTPHQQHRGSCL
uniref:Uncharacterized protein n=1 Tax=Arundo donax TaxID=35708 RepID=A0A0A9DWR1_ARUDO